MLKEKKLSKKRLVILSSLFVAARLGIQLVAATAWTADAANRGPQIVILQMSQDPDTNWAVQDLQARLSTFITDDPFFPDRVRLIKTSDPYVATELDGAIIIYASHGGPLGIVTGKRLMLWETMASIVSNSHAIMHLFTACSSRNIIQYGDESSGKKLYSVPGARPAEVTDVEIVSAIMLALGVSSGTVDTYRTAELTKAKDIVESGSSVHIMDFSQIILDEVEYVDDHYSDTYTDTHRVYRYSVEQTLSGDPGFVSLPLDLQSTIVDYYRSFITPQGEPDVRILISLGITYTKNYYYEATWIVDETPPPDPDPIPPPDPDPIPPPRPDPGDPGLFSASYIMTAEAASGHWENGPDIFSGGTYSGVAIYSGDGCDYLQVAINVTASGTTLDANGKTNPESISLNQIDVRGIYVQKQKIDGVWQEPVTGRSPSRTGGQFTDPCVKADYEYDSSWPNVPGVSGSSGALSSTGEYLTITGIPTGTAWHGPSFVRTLPSYFKLKDLGTLLANLSIVQHGSASPLSFTAVCLYDVDKKLVAVIDLIDYWGSLQESVYQVRYYKADGTAYSVGTPHFVGDTSGIVQFRYDPLRGIFGDAPGISDTCLAYRNQLGNEGERLIKYLVIQSCRYGSNPEQDERIYSISLSYAGSEYTVFHDTCNDMDEFVKTPDFPYGGRSDGTLAVPSGQSYMEFTSIATGTGWHGPIYINTLDRPFRLYQLDEFSVIGELVQSSNTMGTSYVALFDENKQCVLLIHWGDAWVDQTKGYFSVYFYPQNGATCTTGSYIYSSFTRTGKMWWGPAFGGDGGIYYSIDGSGDIYPLGECDNASRVIKYVGILGYRYNSYNLVDMRIHDINVVTNLNTHDPNAPSVPPPTQDPPVGQSPVVAPSDGTASGSYSETDRAEVDAQLSSAQNYVSVYWTGWWPTLHIVVNWALSATAYINIHLAIDILLNVQVLSGEVQAYTPVLEQNGYTGSAATSKAQSAAYKMLSESSAASDPWFISHLLELAVFVVFQVLSWNPSPWVIAAYLIAFGLFSLSIMNAINYERAMVREGEKDRVEASLAIIGDSTLVFADGLYCIAEGVHGFMSAEDKGVDAVMEYGYKVVPWGQEHTISLYGLLSGIAMIILAVGMMIVGVLVGLGLFPC